MAVEMKQTKVQMHQPIYLGMSILDISKTRMHEFWYDNVKPKYQDRAKLCHMNTESFVIDIKTEDFYKGVANDVEKLFDTYLTIMKMIKDRFQLPIDCNKKESVF